MAKILKWPWAQLALWIVGVFALLIGAGGDYGPNWGAIVAGAVFVAAAIALAFLRVLRKKHEPSANPAEVRPPLTGEEHRKRRGRTRLVSILVMIVAIALALTVSGNSFLQRLRTYEDVTVNTSRGDVLYRLGYPPIVLGDLEGGANPFRSVYYTDQRRDPRNAMPAGTEPNDYRSWSYEARNSYSPDLTVEFDADGRVVEVACIQLESARGYCSPLFGIRVGDTEEAMIARLGQPNQARLSGVAKIVRYNDIGAEFTLTRGRVYRLTLLRAKGSSDSIFTRYLRGWLSWW